MKRFWIASTLSSAALAAGLVTIAVRPAAAAPKPHVPATLYVAPPTGRSSLPPVCQTAPYTDINAAIAATVAGDRVVVCPGTYTGSATVTTGESVQPTITAGVYVDKSIALLGMSGVIVNATGLDNGITVFGVNGAKVMGFTVDGAFGEGIFVAASTRITVDWNTVKGNDVGTATTAYFECQTKTEGVLGDCGYGIHLLSVTHSWVLDNTVQFNSGGILLSDEFGPTKGNTVSGNAVVDNALRSGIKLAGRSATGVNASDYPTPKLGGVYSNSVSDNIVMSNGLTGKGGGIVLTVGVKGGACYGNLVDGNEISGNGFSGITIRRHFVLADVNGDLLFDNWIGTNNLTGDVGNPSTTGIYVERDSTSIPPISVTAFDNTISFNHYGIFDTATPGLTRFGNHFVKDVVDVAF